MPLLANGKDGMWVCEKGKKKRKPKDETARVKDWEGIVFFFSFKRELTDGKSGSDERRVKMKNESKEADMKRKRSSGREGSVTETPLTCSQV